MWFMNKVANPLVRLVLQSPLHGLMSAAVLLITYRGRKTGRDYTLPVQYVQDGHWIYILPGMPEKKTWWRNLRGGLPVRLRLAGKTLPAGAELMDGETDPASAARALDLYLHRFPSSAKIHNVRRESGGGFNEDDLNREARFLIVVRVDLDQC